MTPVLAIDLGGTRLRAGLADLADAAPITPLGEWQAPQSPEAFRGRIGELLVKNGAARLGIGVPGLARGSVCTWIPNLGYLDGIDLAEWFPRVEIALGNDAQFSLLAEATAGAAAGLADVILLAIGTGIGSAVLSGGSIVKGSRGGACSFGWASADMNDGGHERSGWLERHASGRALDDAAGAIGLADGAALITAARNGDVKALAALDPPMRALGTSLAGAVALLDPEIVVLSGGVAAAADVVAPMILAALRRHLPPHLRGIEIRPGQFGPAAGLTGAMIAGRKGADWGKLP